MMKNQGNQDTPSVDELVSDGRYNQVLEHLRLTHLSPKGHIGISVGRYEMLSGLADYFASQWHSTEEGTIQGDDCATAVLTTAPGVDSTTMRGESTFRIANQGIAVIEVQPSQLANEQRLIKALQRYANQKPLREPTKSSQNPSLIRRAWHNHHEWLARSKSVTIIADGASVALLNGEHPVKLITTGGITAAQEAMNSLRDRTKQKRLVSAEEALRMLNETYAGKFIITVDECRKLVNSELQTEDMQANIELRAYPTGQAQINPQGGSLLLAGPASFSDDLEWLGLTRVNVEWLEELDDDSAVPIIRHYLMHAEVPKQWLGAVAGRWVLDYEHAFRYWPQHIATTGVFANKLLIANNRGWKHNPADPDKHELLRHPITLAARDNQSLHRERLRNAKKAQPTIPPEDMTAFASIADDQIPQKALIRPVTTSTVEGGVLVTEGEIEDSLRDLKPIGPCRNWTVNRDCRHEECRRFAIPSLHPHIGDNVPLQRMRKGVKRAKQIIRDTGDWSSWTVERGRQQSASCKHKPNLVEDRQHAQA